MKEFKRELIDILIVGVASILELAGLLFLFDKVGYNTKPYEGFALFAVILLGNFIAIDKK